ncbi:DoxX family membrane protein [Spongiimicrobium salis]|uniref:DoxX family membrane protein n=1 Tax=Spongiimicrobium salis TaxID=1667022 RepID=UPI00374D4A26
MITYLKSISKAQYWDYFILVSRFLLGFVFLSYGYGKLTDGQFGITPEELATPVQDLSFFKLSWYLFDQQPFKAFVGISQLVCGLLLMVNRTALVGAFLFLPIVSTILIIDMTFMPKAMAYAFTWRLSFYILLDFLILWHYKDKMALIGNAVWNNVNTKFRFPLWAYLILPVMALALEFFGALPGALLRLLFGF